MSNRHLARTIAMQSLYEWDFLGQRAGDIGGLLKRNAQAFASNFNDEGFAAELVAGVQAHLSEIDAVITKYAPEWPIEQITIVDRNILRLGVLELLFSDNVPSKVAINEAIELAKAFGGESSGRFVNGVLGALYRDRTADGEIKPVDLEEKKPAEQKVAATPAKTKS